MMAGNSNFDFDLEDLQATQEAIKAFRKAMAQDNLSKRKEAYNEAPDAAKLEAVKQLADWGFDEVLMHLEDGRAVTINGTTHPTADIEAVLRAVRLWKKRVLINSVDQDGDVIREPYEIIKDPARREWYMDTLKKTPLTAEQEELKWTLAKLANHVEL